MSKSDKRLLPLAEAAAFLSTTVWAARGLIWDGRLPYVRLGGGGCWCKCETWTPSWISSRCWIWHEPKVCTGTHGQNNQGF